ncbi:uncharacterized protein LOC116296952 [Actinia tenebrosa]|uniref:Uncharacterized protein LOC116296952 n=1 Tax=Actinia tenebrosa TaxID=6105 RepID=A0A6P8HZS9_ACTTE|nr:uncharacterized protein LOC116296952 [Actinia tenebrosa]
MERRATCLILYFYIRCYNDINSAILHHETTTRVNSYIYEGHTKDSERTKEKIQSFPLSLQSSKASKAALRNLSRDDDYHNLKESRYTETVIQSEQVQIQNQKNSSRENQILMLREIIDDFKFQWLRYSKAGLDWKEILNPCKNDMEWKKKGLETINRSSGNTSEILSLDIRPAGEFSRVFIRSRTADGRLKTVGGDSWRVYVAGPSSLVAKVFDYNNGTYEALFLTMEPGVYEVIIILDYSLCDGLRDPPGDWFIKGNKQGKYQKEGFLGKLDDFLFQRLGSFEQQGKPLTINVPAARVQADLRDLLPNSPSSSCLTSCRFLWNGYGRWANKTWLPFFQETFHWHNYPHPSPSGTLWVYGDSVGMIFVQSMKKRTMCDQLYEQCKLSYNWIYPILSGHKRAIEEYDVLDFDEKRVIKSIRDVLSDPDMDSNSTLLLNLGLHFVMTINFTTYQKLIDHVIDMLTEKKPGSEHDLWYKSRVVWKTTTAIMKENASQKQVTHFRFLTSQRILLFNAYATWAMCKAGVDVIDVHPITDSYPWGPMDVVHYYGFVTYPLEQRLEALQIATVSSEGDQDKHSIQTCVRS